MLVIRSVFCVIILIQKEQHSYTCLVVAIRLSWLERIPSEDNLLESHRKYGDSRHSVHRIAHRRTRDGCVGFCIRCDRNIVCRCLGALRSVDRLIVDALLMMYVQLVCLVVHLAVLSLLVVHLATMSAAAHHDHSCREGFATAGGGGVHTDKSWRNSLQRGAQRARRRVRVFEGQMVYSTGFCAVWAPFGVRLLLPRGPRCMILRTPLASIGREHFALPGARFLQRVYHSRTSKHT